MNVNHWLMQDIPFKQNIVLLLTKEKNLPKTFSLNCPFEIAHLITFRNGQLKTIDHK